MAMILVKKIPLQVDAVYTGVDRVDAAAGKTLKIETTPDGEEVLNTVVPAGKTWVVTISVNIIENNV